MSMTKNDHGEEPGTKDHILYGSIPAEYPERADSWRWKLDRPLPWAGRRWEKQGMTAVGTGFLWGADENVLGVW